MIHYTVGRLIDGKDRHLDGTDPRQHEVDILVDLKIQHVLTTCGMCTMCMVVGSQSFLPRCVNFQVAYDPSQEGDLP